MTEMLNYRKEQLELLAERLFLTAGLRKEDAAQIAKDLVTADMRGLSSHGVSRIPMYLKRLDEKCVNPVPEIKVEQRGLAVLKVDGDDGMGFLVAHRAMEEGIKLAERTGIALVGCTRSTHYGMAALYIRQAMEKGFLSMVFTNSSSALPAYGGRTAFLGAAPFAAGLPGGFESPGYTLDMAMTVTARGKIRLAMINGQPIAEGLALDKEGAPTTNAKEAFEGICLPFGGPKGSGLAMLMDMLAGMFTGSLYAGDVSSLYYRFDEPQNLGHIMFIMRPDLFIPEEEYKRRMDDYYHRLKELPLAKGFDEILMPGEPELRKYEAAEKNGIFQTKEVMDSLFLECRKRGIDCPEVFGEDWQVKEGSGSIVFDKENVSLR